MKKLRYLTARVGFIFVVSTLLLSCSGTVYVNASHTRHQVKEKVLPLVAGKSVALENYYHNASQVTLYEKPNSTRLVGDLRQYTDATLNILKSELIKRDVLVAENHFKTVILKISDVQATNKVFNKTTALKLTASLKNGRTATISATYRTGGSSEQALDGAIIAAITQLLKSDTFVEYINN